MTPPRLALVPGEPAGIGPELCVHLAQRERDAALLALADPHTLQAAAQAIGLPLDIRIVDNPEQVDQADRPGTLSVLPIPQAVPTRLGHGDPRNSAAVIDALLRAGHGCLHGGFDGVITGPVNKELINAGGIVYTGTTELLAEQADAEVVMMLANPALRVALVTTHLPLRAVPAAITRESVGRALRILHRALRDDFGIAAPRIAVLGLNPHAGENGLLGDEEIDHILPAMRACEAEGMRLIGPLPADTAFLPHKLAEFDAVLAMYHDQGLPVLKHSGFEQAVNITLGLPYPRVAVDHGTALELAGKGIAKPDSLFAAYDACLALARHRA